VRGGLTSHDVVMGRGTAANLHSGNRAFRDLVTKHAPTYHLLLTNGQQVTTTDAVIAAVHEAGRDAVDGNWVEEVTRQRARLKTQNLLRAYISDFLRRQRAIVDNKRVRRVNNSNQKK
jgi:hypothetical protein